jgi:DNA-binding NarL/FixJ family response regulator
MRPILVVVISTNALTRGGIQLVVAQSDIAIQVTGLVDNFRDLHELLERQHAHVVIIDDFLPRGTHLAQEVKKLSDRHSSLAILMIAYRPTASLVRLLLERGVRGMMHRDDNLERGLINAIQTTAEGGLFVSASISRLINDRRPLPVRVEQRDLDVLQLLAEGFQAKEISAHLGLTTKSVYRILQTLRHKLEAQSNAQMVDIARQKKLLAPIDDENHA